MTRLAVQTKLSLLVAACVLGLVISLKNVVGVSAEVLSKDIVPYLVIYPAFALVPPVKEGGTGVHSLFLWGLVVVLTTAAIVTLYAVPF